LQGPRKTQIENARQRRGPGPNVLLLSEALTIYEDASQPHTPAFTTCRDFEARRGSGPVGTPGDFANRAAPPPADIFGNSIGIPMTLIGPKIFRVQADERWPFPSKAGEITCQNSPQWDGKIFRAAKSRAKSIVLV